MKRKLDKCDLAIQIVSGYLDLGAFLCILIYLLGEILRNVALKHFS